MRRVQARHPRLHPRADCAAGKVDWLARGLAAEGRHAKRPTAESLAPRDAATCQLGTSAGEAIRAIGESHYGKPR
jgi:hypothetical protein